MFANKFFLKDIEDNAKDFKKISFFFTDDIKLGSCIASVNFKDEQNQ